MSWTDDTIFKRTEAGDQEIRERALQLAKMDQIVLVSIDGVSTVELMLAPFDVDARNKFRESVKSLLGLGLIEALARLDMGSGDPTSDDFFSSSMGGVESGSGLVVDTKSNSVRSVRQRSKQDDVDLFIPLDGEEIPDKSKRVKKLVEVYPAPKRQKKKRKKSVAPPQNKWVLRAYIALLGLGLVVVIAAILM
ncbi:hypothetical protein RF679_18815 [Undibacterium cyanobacteriorum]|uniref:Flagellar M-ring C-terminal domain-containing protein n=1 Tax=Undibacterium cyanobacteriorum TaxID=3073561 RepID=A0ABY9RJX2_9BURK|nr:hypothetical protein [Undibacterium sp. 20NA77.5]WMW80667.1 hypothetical protein RF679_18815 [Undibacterium sp. 20NA77.5]